ncbi:MAG: hypothetical protein EBZ48_03315, partial [Proteobacteria bacterium]|nr:hypothetical protein [Pseudomonadota bacterium]
EVKNKLECEGSIKLKARQKMGFYKDRQDQKSFSIKAGNTGRVASCRCDRYLSFSPVMTPEVVADMASKEMLRRACEGIKKIRKNGNFGLLEGDMTKNRCIGTIGYCLRHWARCRTRGHNLRVNLVTQLQIRR